MCLYFILLQEHILNTHKQIHTSNGRRLTRKWVSECFVDTVGPENKILLAGWVAAYGANHRQGVPHTCKQSGRQLN